MTKQEVIDAVTQAVMAAVSGKGLNDSLSESQAVDVTDAAAAALDTVNPSGPCYPSTPR